MTMLQTAVIQQHYDEVIAPHYDLDPQGVIGGSLDRAMAQLRDLAGADTGAPLNVLDIGMGTGRFLAKARDTLGRPLHSFGLDLSPRMVDVARARIPDLAAMVGDAAALETYFPGLSFDLIATHFITGFVPAAVLAPKIHDRLTEGGYWSVVGGTKRGFPALQRTANRRLLRWLLGAPPLRIDDLVVNPAGRDDLVQTLEANGFTVRACETFQPALQFANFTQFLEFAYYGGWLTPFIEALGLHQARPATRLFFNTFVFPMTDRHDIEIILAQKVR